MSNVDDTVFADLAIQSKGAVNSPNLIGIYDIIGNNGEWTNDWYGFNYYKDSPKNNPKGPIPGQGSALSRSKPERCH